MKKNYECSPERFIEAWQAANCVADVASALEMPTAIASARACTYRKMGIHLKKMYGGTPKLDLDKLKKLADSIAATNNGEATKSELERDATFPY